MATRRHPSAPIQTVAQLRVLASAVAREIIQALRTGGPATVAQLGPRLGRRANSLHYHVRKLARVGFVRKTGTRQSGARIEAVYDVVADHFLGPSAPAEPRLRDATNDVVASLLRHAARDFARASRDPAALVESGPRRNITADRYTAWLSPAQLAEVNRHLAALLTIFSTQEQAGAGELCMLTIALAPVRQKPHESNR